MKTKLLLLGMTLFLLTFNSCNKDDQGNSSELNADEATVNAKIDVATDDASVIVDEQLQLTLDNPTGKSSLNTEDDCPVITRVPVGIPDEGQLVTKTLDFGTTDDCLSPTGNILRGKIIITFNYHPNATSHTVTCTFQNFGHNNLIINGTKTFTRIMTGTPSHPKVTVEMNITVASANGTYTRTGTRVRETIEDNTTSDIDDKMYKITGNWTTTLPNGSVQTSVITTPLIRRLNCQWIASGVITITRNEVEAILDFGNLDDDPLCNRQATVSINGGTPINIILGEHH